MIIYYRVSDGMILSVRGNAGKKHLTDIQLQAECNAMFPNETTDDVQVKRFPGDVDASPAGIWDPATDTMITPPPNTAPAVHPHKDRIKAISDKMALGTATTAEVQEYLSKMDMHNRIVSVQAVP